MHMNYDATFLDDEIRCEYHVTEKQKKIWTVQLDLLYRLQLVCKKHGLKCFAYGGTLLGAVRHSGYIPWDDDIDVALNREDYNKLCEVAACEFEDPYFFQTALTDRNYFVGHARLRRSDTTGIISFMSDHIYNNGIFIDICVYDQVPKNKIRFNLLLERVKFFRFLLNNHYNKAQNRSIKKFFLWLFNLIRPTITYEELFQMYKKRCESYLGTETDLLALLCTPEFIKYKATRKGTSNLVMKDFEFLTILVPNDYDYMLKKAYGDYMVLPPVEERGKWHEGIITYDPDISYLDYCRLHPDIYKNLLNELNSSESNQRLC